MEELDLELENLNLILIDLLRKKMEKEHIKEELGEELDLINKEVNYLNQVIKEKEEKRIFFDQEVRVHYDDIEIFGKWDNQDFTICKSIAQTSSFFPNFPSIVKGRLIPVNNDGIPVEQLGENKWTRKN